MKQTGENLPRSELRHQPAWQRRQRWLSALCWLLICALPLSMLLPLLVSARAAAAPVPKTGDALLDDLIKVTLQDWKLHPSRYRMTLQLELPRERWAELSQRFPNDPRVDELFLQNYRFEDQDSPSQTALRAIEKAKAAGRRNAALVLEERNSRRQLWRRQWRDAQQDKTPASQLTQQEREARNLRMYRDIEREHGAENAALLAELRSLEPDNGYIDLLEMADLLNTGQLPAAWKLLRQSNARARCQWPDFFPASDWQRQLINKSWTSDPLAGLTLASYEEIGLRPGGMSGYLGELAGDAAVRGDLHDLQQLHMALCRLARSPGIGASASKAAVRQLNDLASLHLPLALRGQPLPAAAQKLSARTSTLLNNYSAVGQSIPGAPGPAAQSGSFAWADLLVQAYVEGSDSTWLMLNVYNKAYAWRSAIQPGGKFYTEIEDLERFDYRTLNWTAKGANPVGAP